MSVTEMLMMDCSKRRIPVGQHTVCRLCLCSSNSLGDVFRESDDYGFLVKEAIEDLLRFEVSKVNGSPWLICSTCVSKLNEFRMFKSRCLDAKVTFESRFPAQCSSKNRQNISDKQSTDKPQTVIILPLTHSSAMTNINSMPSCPLFLSEAVNSLPEQLMKLSGAHSTIVDPRGPIKNEISECENGHRVNGKRGDSLADESDFHTNKACVIGPQIQYVHPTDNKVSSLSNGTIPSKDEPRKVSQMESIEDEEIPSKKTLKIISPNNRGIIVSQIARKAGKSSSFSNKPVVKDSSGKRCETATSLGANMNLTVPSDVKHMNCKAFVIGNIKSITPMSDSSESSSYLRGDGYGVSTLFVNRVNMIPIVHGSDPAPPKAYKCELCEERFQWKEKLDNHMLTHPEGMKPYKCSNCNKSYADKRSVRRHMLSHLTAPIVLECPECNKTFTRLNALKNHSKKHRKELFQCKICQKTFKHRATRSRHMKIHVQGKAFLCQECGKSFSFQYDLTNHLRGHSDQKPYLCEVCGKGFNKPQYLRYHLQVHSEVKRHTCGECGKAFAQYSALWQHKKWHKGEKRFVCEVCSKGFVLNCQLVQHRKKHAVSLGATSTKSITKPS